MRFFLLCLAALIVLPFGVAFYESGLWRIIVAKEAIDRGLSSEPERCKNVTVTMDDSLACIYPFPPLGRWHAVYTAEFAKTHNLPLENVSLNMPLGFDYMEMEVIPTIKTKRPACMVNMLVKKPHDISLFGGRGDSGFALPDDRKLLHLVDIQQYLNQLKPLRSFYFASKNFSYERDTGFAGTADGFYAEDVLDGYDYLSIHYNCRGVSMHPQYFPNGYALQARKASVWSKYDMRYNGYSDPAWPKDLKPEDSHFFVSIPEEIFANIFKDVPLGGK